LPKVIGKAGARINLIRQASGCKVWFKEVAACVATRLARRTSVFFAGRISRPRTFACLFCCVGSIVRAGDDRAAGRGHRGGDLRARGQAAGGARRAPADPRPRTSPGARRRRPRPRGHRRRPRRRRSWGRGSGQPRALPSDARARARDWERRQVHQRGSPSHRLRPQGDYYIGGDRKGGGGFY
jgi:hypothetical protein